jgi:hypothetical protein
MERNSFILSALENMTTADLHAITGLDIVDHATGKEANLAWVIEAVGGTLRWAILADLKDMVVEAYNADGVDAKDAATVLPWIENLRRDTRLIDYIIVSAAHRVAPLGGDYTLEIGPSTTVAQIISDTMQQVYDHAAQRLVEHLENEARNNPEVEL